MTIRVFVNDVEVVRVVEPRMLLSDFLRRELALTATHVGCETGVCGACNVLFDGVNARSCLLFAVQADGHRVTTAEGLADIDELRERFVERRAFQCGFCTPGFLVSLAEAGPSLAGRSEGEIRSALVGNVCRCTGYNGIVEAVKGTWP